MANNTVVEAPKAGTNGVHKEVKETNIPVELIYAEDNYRKRFDDKAHGELRDSIKKVGVLQPIIVRKDDGGGFIIVAGERRYRAAKAAGLKLVPVRVFDITADEAKEIGALENIQRRDLDPVEEAFALKDLLSTGHHDVKSLAERIGKSEQHVTRAVRMAELPGRIHDKIIEGHIGAAHAHQILRTPEKYWPALITFATTMFPYHKRYPTLEEMKDRIERTVEKDLSRAIFPTTVANYGGTEQPACGACPYNTGNQGTLFDGAQKGSCTNPGCFNKRTAARYKELVEDGEKKTGLPFIGAARGNGYSSTDGYGSFTIKGYRGMGKNTKLADVQKLAKKHPGKYGFAIVKPDTWGGHKMPWTTLVTKMPPSEAAEHGRPDYEKQEFVSEAVVKALQELALKKVSKLSKKHVLQMIEEFSNHSDHGMAVDDKKSIDELLVHLWLMSLGGWSGEMVKRLKDVGIDAKETVKAATKAAESEYKKKVEEAGNSKEEKK